MKVLEQQLKDTIDFEMQAMKAYLKLVKQHRNLKRKFEGKSLECVMQDFGSLKRELQSRFKLSL